MIQCIVSRFPGVYTQYLYSFLVKAFYILIGTFLPCPSRTQHPEIFIYSVDSNTIFLQRFQYSVILNNKKQKVGLGNYQKHRYDCFKICTIRADFWKKNNHTNWNKWETRKLTNQSQKYAMLDTHLPCGLPSSFCVR